MREIQILAGFTGYPNGKKRAFVPGVENVAEGYADLLVAKGLAKPIQPPAAATVAKGSAELLDSR